MLLQFAISNIVNVLCAGGKTAKRDWVMNMNGCSYLSEFHEYVCRALQKQPVYEYKQLGETILLEGSLIDEGGA